MSSVNLIPPSSKWDGSFIPPAGNQTLDTIKTWINGLSLGIDFINTTLLYMADTTISGWSSCTVIRTLDNITTVTLTNESTIIQMRRTAAGDWYVGNPVPARSNYIIYQDFTDWKNVPITQLSAAGNMYFTPASSKKDVTKAGYTAIAVSLIDWSGMTDMVGLYLGSTTVGAYSKTSQTVPGLSIRVAYEKT